MKFIVFISCCTIAQVPDEEVQHKFVGFACDGAATNMGRYNGVQARLCKETAPRLITTHCAAHRENLVGQKVGSDRLFKVVSSLVQAVYNYFKSPKRWAGLLASGRLLEMELKKLLNPGGTRWLSIRECMANLLHNMPAVLHRFQYMHKEEGEVIASGILNSLLNIQTHISLYLFTFLVDELGTLNKALQASDILLADVANMVSSTARRLREVYCEEQGFAKLYELSSEREHNPWADLRKFLDYGLESKWEATAPTHLVLKIDETMAYQLTTVKSSDERCNFHIMEGAFPRAALEADIHGLLQDLRPHFADVGMSTCNELLRRFPNT